MDYVYICRTGDNEELRYSLRSIEENAPEGRVWVVGGKPDWYVGDFIEVPDIHTKFNNINNCIEAAINHPELSEDFVMMNDDFFVLSKVNSFPTFYGGKLRDRKDEYSLIALHSPYTRLLIRTYNQLFDAGIYDPLDYDIHMPMVFNKEKLKSLMPIPYLVRSIYGNMFSIGGTEVKDTKVYGTPGYEHRSHDVNDQSFPFVSTEDSSFEKLYEAVLKDKFNFKGIYEY
jgi:hypothetical protein